MKKIISLCLITFLCTNLYAQESIEVEPTEKSVEAVKLTNPVNPSKITLYAEPFWFIIRKLSLDLQFQVGKKITVGPLLSYRSDDATFSSGFILIGDQKIKEREFGVRSNFYFAGAHKHSAYLGLSLVRSEVDITRFTDFFTGASGSASYSLNKLTLLGGFRWKWGRVSLGVGGFNF